MVFFFPTIYIMTVIYEFNSLIKVKKKHTINLNCGQGWKNAEGKFCRAKKLTYYLYLGFSYLKIESDKYVGKKIWLLFVDLQFTNVVMN